MKKAETRVLKGRSASYGERIAGLFLQEVENIMYDKREIDLLPSGDVEDIVLAVQNPWFRDIALRHRIWFPNNLGGRAARYVAHYETADDRNANPSSIAYIARNRIMWNKITIEEAKEVPDLHHAFADQTFSEEVASWERESKHCIVLTDEPEKLRVPLLLAEKKYLARIMAGWYISFASLQNARNLDDLQP